MPVEGKRAAFVDFGMAIARRADENVAVTVAVDVARAAHGCAQMGAGLIKRLRPDGGRAQPGRRAGIELHLAFAGLALAEAGRADEDVSVAVAVHVSGQSHGCAQLSISSPPFDAPPHRRRQADARPQVEEGRAFRRMAVGVPRRADDDVAVAVAVHIPRQADRGAE